MAADRQWCEAASSVGNLVSIDGILDKAEYLNIFMDNLKYSEEKLNLPNNQCFQQDNSIRQKSLSDIVHLTHITTSVTKFSPQSH